jgi:hypothetical protein
MLGDSEYGLLPSTSMSKEKRKSIRRSLHRSAKIQARPDTPSFDCVVTEISEGGVQLQAASGRVTNRFTLLFGNMRRECRVIWRAGNTVGAAFLDG